MLKELLECLKKPDLYAQSTSEFWDNVHISKGMLEAHLHPNWEAASRRHDFIDKSAEWIAQIAPSSTYRNILDLGCGPGLYAERLYEKGYNITGIDFSQRSINYARKKARERNQEINYIYKNYMDIDYKNEFEIVILIYCDFGVLSDIKRQILLKKIYKSLIPGGKFIFDVFTLKEFEEKPESSTWYISEEGGFWKPDKHICLESHFIYEGDVRLNQYVIIDKDEKIHTIRNWHKHYTKDSIISEIKKAGFNKIDIYSDVTGKQYSEYAKTMGIVVEK